MTPILIILLVSLIASGVGIYLRGRPSNEAESPRPLPPGTGRGLFEPSTDEVEHPRDQQAQLREQLLRRAAGGDLGSLDDAQRRGQNDVYAEILDALIQRVAGQPEQLDGLVSYISKSGELRTNARLARHVIEEWKAAPGDRSATEMLHAAALSDDAATYHEAVDAVVDALKTGKLLRLSVEDLISLVESQYWVLASEARRGGAGFALRKRLAGIRRELAARMPAR